MPVTTTGKEHAHIGAAGGLADHDRALIHELSKRLDCLWRCDQHIANAEGDAELQTFWRDIKRRKISTVDRARRLIRAHVQRNCF